MKRKKRKTLEKKESNFVMNDNMMAIRDMAAYSAEMAKIDNTELHVTIQKVKRAELPKELTLGTLIKIRLMVEELCVEPIKEKKEKNYGMDGNY